MDIRFMARTADRLGGLDGLADHACRLLRLRLMERSDQVAHVAVKIGDAGVAGDTYCVMQVQVRGAPAATVVDMGTDAYDTISRTVARIGRLVEGQLRLAAAGRLALRAPDAIAA